MSENSKDNKQSWGLLTRYLKEDVVKVILDLTPEEWIKDSDPDIKYKFRYVEIQNYIKRFNEAFGFLWSHKVIKDWMVNKDVITLNEITFHIPGRRETRIIEHPDGRKETTIIITEKLDIVKTQYGTAQVKNNVELGHIYKMSASDGLKKCGLETGFFADVYEKDESLLGSSRERLASSAQMESINYRAQNLGWSEEDLKNWINNELQRGDGKIPEDSAGDIIRKLIGLVGTDQDRNKEK